jgi:hypothetical protein
MGHVRKVEVTLWLTVSQSVCLGVGHPFGAHDQILLFPFFCRKIALLFVLGRPLWREDGSVICSAIYQWSESRRTHNHTLLPHLRLHWGLRSRYDWRSVSQYVLTSSPAWDLRPDINSVRFCCVVFVGRPLWREVGYVSLSVTVSNNCPSWSFMYLFFYFFIHSGSQKCGTHKVRVYGGGGLPSQLIKWLICTSVWARHGSHAAIMRWLVMCDSSCCCSVMRWLTQPATKRRLRLTAA